jgi:2-succinyl-5-enolpyruvyl-6-hydroxy-3-cyclohexene-1-carboxylate synthase
MNAGARNLAWADAFVAALVAAGLRHLVLAPGARSAPPALAALRRPELQCHVINDERAAGFFALGLGKAGGRPAAVLTTSGTAAANLLPAIVEANLARVPLLALTADRPAELHGWGSNQTVDQTKLYGDQVRAFHALPAPGDGDDASTLRLLAARLIEACVAPRPGPVHANLPFREPLLPLRAEDIPPAPPPLPAPIALAQSTAVPDSEAVAALAARIAGRPGVIVCGGARYPAGFATAVTQLAARLDAPILAEPLSGLRCGPHDQSRVLARQALFLRDAPPPAPDWVMRFGAFPVSRTLERWLAGLSDALHILVAPPGEWPDPLRRSDALLRGDPLAVIASLLPQCRPASADFRRAWQNAEAQAAAAVAARCSSGPLFEGAVARALLDALPDGAQLFVGNSLAIRALDSYGGTAEKPLSVYGNRGASGIDGNLATAAGVAAAADAPIALLVGDQTLLHDCGSLALLAGRDAAVVVMDNGGGGIFDHLPFAAALPADLLRRGWTAPPRADFAALAAAFGLGYAEAADRTSLRDALTRAAGGGAWLVRAAIDRDASRAQFR